MSDSTLDKIGLIIGLSPSAVILCAFLMAGAYGLAVGWIGFNVGIAWVALR